MTIKVTKCKSNSSIDCELIVKQFENCHKDDLKLDLEGDCEVVHGICDEKK